MTFAMKMRDEWKAGMSEGRMEGRKEGRKEGIKEGRKEGRKEGIKEGRKEGIKSGAQKERAANLQHLVAQLKISAEQAMDLLQVPAAERPMYQELLQGTH